MLAILLATVTLFAGGHHHHHYHCYHRSGNVACYYNTHERHITMECTGTRDHLRCVQIG